MDDALAISYLTWEGKLDQFVKSAPSEESRIRGLRYPRLLARGNDRCYFVNLFVPIPDLIPHGWRLDGEVWPLRFRAVRARLVELLEEAKARPKPNPNHLAKIRWLVSQFNANVDTAGFRDHVATIGPIPF